MYELKPTSLATSIVIGLLLAVPARAQKPAAAQGALPSELILVKGGKIEVGVTAKALVDMAQALAPSNPTERRKLIQNTISELGEPTTKTVADFYLAKNEVTNEEYKAFIDKTGRRPPFHWWSEGNKQDFEAARPKFNTELRGEAPRAYWEQNWKTLKWAIPAGQERFPVTMVTWREAQAFAGWCGMRLPTEEEWMLAATGGKRTEYLGGDKPPKVESRLKAVGGGAPGPFGHLDLTGNVWEFIDNDGYFPVAGREAFEKEWSKLQKAKEVQEFASKLERDWDGSKRLAKGGAFFSASAPVQLRLSVRTRLQPDNGVEGVGIRLAKSLEPARDMVLSRVRAEYDASAFGADRKPNIADAVGIERYQLTQGGARVADYQALAIVPVNLLCEAKESKTLSLDKLRQISEEKPIVVATLLITVPLETPKLEPGMYTIFYRHHGVPADLAAAIAEGLKEAKSKPVEKEEKEKDKKKGEAAPDEKDKEAGKKDKNDWRTVLKKYGIADDPEVLKTYAGGIKELTLKDGNYKIPTKDELILFHKSGTGFVAHITHAKNDLSLNSGYKTATIELAKKVTQKAGADVSTEVYNFDFGVPHGSNQHVFFHVPLASASAPDEANPWRTPTALKVAAAAPSNGADKSSEPAKDTKVEKATPPVKSK